ncbi:MAG: sensor histidine kinase [Saprospiraceae bacterium]|nr:sensor histidine kinase [Saprospiraceae bacterium]
MLKNASPRQLAFFSAASITILVAGLNLIFAALNNVEIDWVPFALFTILLFLTSFFVILFLLRWYIYRRIKLIYKSIHTLKAPSKNKQGIVKMDEDILGDVEKEVSEWALSQEKEISQLKALEDYRRAYVGNVSHELKTPLFAVQGYIHSLLEGGMYDERVHRRFLLKASRNLDRLQTIVEDLDSIARLETGEVDLELEDFDIKKVTTDILEDMEMLANEREISLKFKEGASNTYRVHADKSSIRQVLVNLITNSIKYGKSGGLTKIGFYDMGANILIEVADDGIGISEKEISRVFDRFYRVDKSRSRKGGGSGLGLSIVKHIIESHGQTINVRSTLAVGSTFGFTLKKA